MLLLCLLAGVPCSVYVGCIARGAISPIAQQSLFNMLSVGRSEQPFKVLPGEETSLFVLMCV